MNEPQNLARIEYDWQRCGLKVQLVRRPGDGTIHVRDFGDPIVKTARLDESGSREIDAQPLWIDEDEARALYEALADHFGHSGNDTRALRRDYDAERSRVDRLITFAIGPK